MVLKIPTTVHIKVNMTHKFSVCKKEIECAFWSNIYDYATMLSEWHGCDLLVFFFYVKKRRNEIKTNEKKKIKSKIASFHFPGSLNSKMRITKYIIFFSFRRYCCCRLMATPVEMKSQESNSKKKERNKTGLLR